MLSTRSPSSPSSTGHPALQSLYARLDAASLAPLWESLHGLVPREPVCSAIPWVWRFENVRNFLLEAGALISAEEAERRVLVLRNPGLGDKLQATDTLYAGMQLILPGEVAPTHRHSQSALRFVVEGTGATTTVDGEPTLMHPGDFIITPSMTWHSHQGGDTEMIWMDGLDVPLTSFLHAGFREEFVSAAPTRPSGASAAQFGESMLPLSYRGKPLTSPIFNYPYERSREALERMRRLKIDRVFGHALRYINPTTGDWAMPTIGATLRLLPKDFATLPYRSTDGLIIVVTEGKLQAQFETTSLEAGPRDTIVLPGWSWYTLRACEDTVIFAYSDQPAQEKLGFWRSESRTPSQINSFPFEGP